MTEGIRKAPDGLTKPLTGHGVGKGSHPMLQALVEAPIRAVPIPDEGMGFVQEGVVGVCDVSSRRGVGRVSAAGRGLAGAAWGLASRLGAARLEQKRHPFPPHPATYVWGVTLNFSPEFSGLCKLANRKE